MSHLSSAWRVPMHAPFVAPARAPHPAVSRHPAAPGPVLAFVDASPEAANAAWRAALVARDRQLPLHLVALEPLEVRLGGAAALAGDLAAHLREHVRLPVSSQGVPGTLDHEGVELARSASLVVLPGSAGRGGWLRGPRALRLLRAAGQPVLVVRQPALASYRRVVAAVEPGGGACTLVAAAHALSRDPRMAVLHVLDQRHEHTMRAVDVPERVIREQRNRDALRARRTLLEAIAGAGAGSSGAQPLVSHGSAARQVLAHELAHRADLLAVGKARRHALADLLLAGVAHAALRDAAADVLVVPLQPRAAGAAWAPPAFAMPLPVPSGIDRPRQEN